MKRLRLRLSWTPLIQSRAAWALLLLSMIAYTLWMTHLTVLRYDTYKATAFDLGNLDQVVWNTIHGRLFQYTNQGADWYGPPTRLAQHVEPILLPLSLLYLYHPDPRMLLIFQTLAMALGALPTFLLTRKYVPEWPLLAPAMAGAYLLMPAMLGANLFDFHPISLVTPLILYAMLALTYRRYGWFLIACVLTASCKEDIPIALGLYGVLIIWKHKLPKLGTILIIGGALWTAIAFIVIIPHFYPGSQHNNFWYRYDDLGSSPGIAIVNILLHPWILLSRVTLDRFYYLAGLLRSQGFLSLFAPEWLIPTLPGLAESLLSKDPLLYSGVYHYNAPIVPFVVLSAIQGTRRLLTFWYHWRGENGPVIADELPVRGDGRISTRSSVGVGTALMTSMLSAVHLINVRLQLVRTALVQAPAFVRSEELLQPGITAFRGAGQEQWQRVSVRMVELAKAVPAPRLQRWVGGWIVVMLVLNFCIMWPWLNIFWPDHEPGSREQHIQQLIDMIPPDVSVAAGNNLNPHLSERQYLTVFPEITYSTSENNKSIVQYIIVDLNDVFPEDKVNTAREVNQLLNSGQFRLLARAEGVILLQKKSP